MTNTSRLRRFLDTGDLDLSAFGDPWHDVPAIRFESTAQLRTAVAQRLDGGAAAHGRRLAAVPAPGHAGAPAAGALREDERSRLILMLLRLEAGDREILRLHLKGLPLQELARRLDLSAETAGMALERAIARARRLTLATETCTTDVPA